MYCLIAHLPRFCPSNCPNASHPLAILGSDVPARPWQHRCSLVLHLQIGICLFHRLPHVGFVHDIIPIKHATAPVPRYFHGNPFRDASARTMFRTAPVRRKSWKSLPALSRLRTGPRPRTAKGGRRNPPAVPVKHPGTGPLAVSRRRSRSRSGPLTASNLLRPSGCFSSCCNVSVWSFRSTYRHWRG